MTRTLSILIMQLPIREISLSLDITQIYVHIYLKETLVIYYFFFFSGFKDVKTACCGFGRYGGMMPCMTLNSACNDSSSHVWWDLYSTTKEVNSLLADWSWLPPDPKLQICKPVTLHELAV